jgi:hypothetical protein
MSCRKRSFLRTLRFSAIKAAGVSLPSLGVAGFAYVLPSASLPGHWRNAMAGTFHRENAG